MRSKLPFFLIPLAGLAGLLAWASACLVEPGEVVVVRRLGKRLEPAWQSGLHWRIPLGIDRIDRVRSDVVRQLTVGLAVPPGSGQDPAAGELMTGDLNLLRVSGAIQYRVVRPVEYVLRAAGVEPILAHSAETSLTRALSVRGVDAVLRTDRQAVAREVKRALEDSSDRYQLGVAILGVSITDARPPGEVEAEFAAVQAAESYRARRANEARSHEETRLEQARAQAQATLERARAASARTLFLTRARAERFSALEAEARRARSLTLRRMYIETMASLLARVKRKLILPPEEAVDLTLLGIEDKARPTGAASPEASSRPATSPTR
jgi:membrane protease subunit HflK